MISLGSAYGEIQIGTQGAQQSIQSLSSTLRNVGMTMTAAISAPLLAVGASAISSAADFEQSLNIMEQVSGATGEQMAALQAQALQLGADTSFSAGEAAKGMLELAKAGMTAEQTGQAIEGVMSLAAAGNLGLAQAAEIAANAINAFNLPASDANRVADMLAAAANSSSVEVTDMAQSFQAASAVFSSSNQSIDDLSTAIAILGNNGLKGSDAGTSLKTMMMRLTAPTKESKKLMDELGISIYDASGATRAFPDILADLQQAMTGMNEVTVVTGGRTREQTEQMKHYGDIIKRTQQKLADYQAGVAGVRQSEEKKAQTIDQLNRELAAAQAAYGQLAGIQGDATTVMKQMTEEERNQALAMIFGADAIRAANILIGEGTDEFNKMKDAVTEQGAASETANARMKGFSGAIEYLKGSIDSFLISTALPFLDMFGGLVRYVADAITALGGLPDPLKNAALAFAAVLAAAGPVLLALSYIGTVLGVLLSPIGLITLAVAGLAAAWVADFGGIQEITYAAWAAIQPVLMNAYTWLQTNIPVALATLKGWWDSVWPTLAGVATAAWAAIGGAISTAWATIQPYLVTLWGWLQVNIPLALTTVQGWFNTAWAAIPGIISTAWATISQTFALVYTWLQVNIPLALSYLQSTWSAVWTTISPVILTAWGVIQPVLNTIYTWLQNNIPTSLGALQALWNAAWPVISGAVSAAWAAVQTTFNLIYTFVAVTIPAGIAYLQAIWNNIWSGISATTATTTGAITTVWNALVAIFGPSIETLKTSFSGMITGFSAMGPQFASLWAAVQPVLEQLKMGVMVLGGIVAGILGGTVIVAINALSAAFQNLPTLVSVVVAQIINALNFISGMVNNVAALVQAIIAGDWSAAWSSAQAIVSGLVAFIQGTLANSLSFVGVLIQFFGDTIANILSSLGFEGAAEKVRTFVAAIVSLFSWVGKLVKGEVAINLQAPAWINSLLAWAWPVIGPAADWVTTLLAWAWPAMAATAEAWVSELMSWGWPDFISQPGWVGSLFDWEWPDFTSQPTWLSTLLDWSWPDIPIPSWLGGGDGNAGGTSYGYGQFSALNERGRELVSFPSDQGILPPGSRVYTHGQSNRMLAGTGTDGGIVVNMSGITIANDRDLHQLANDLGSLLRRKR